VSEGTEWPGAYQIFLLPSSGRTSSIAPLISNAGLQSFGDIEPIFRTLSSKSISLLALSSKSILTFETMDQSLESAMQPGCFTIKRLRLNFCRGNSELILRMDITRHGGCC
jgi:hypothetical protein